MNTTSGCKFRSIRQEIQEYLTQSIGISQKTKGYSFIPIHRQRQTLFFATCSDRSNGTLNDTKGLIWYPLNFHFASLKLGVVKNVVNDCH